MEFQQQWRNCMNGILMDIFTPTTSSMGGGVNNGMGCMYGGMHHPVMDSPPPLQNLSINPQNNYHHNQFYQWESNQRCM